MHAPTARMRTVPLVGIEQTLGVVLVNATSVRLAPVLVRFKAPGEFFCSVGVDVKPLRGWEEASFDALLPTAFFRRLTSVRM